MAVAGPFSDPPDETWAASGLYTVEPRGGAAPRPSRDPSVQAGRMAVQVFNWWTKQGTVRCES